MNKLFDKLDRYLDYNNNYSLRKALTTLDREFNLAMSKHNTNYAKEVINAARLLYDKLERMYKESSELSETMSYGQRIFAQKMRNFIAYLSKKIRVDNRLNEKLEQDIKNIINDE